MPDLYSATNNKTTSPAGVSQGKTSLASSNVEKSRDFVPSRRGHALSALLFQPSTKVRFETQDPEEVILLIARAHWITNLPWLFIALILFFAPAVLTFFPLLVSFPVKFQLMFVVIWYLILLMYIFERFLSWFFNLTIISDERIIDIDFVNLTTKKVSDCDIDKIQDVSFTNAGAIGTIFNYGDVTVQTAAEIVEFVFENVPDPAKIADILQKLRTEEKIEEMEGRVR